MSKELIKNIVRESLLDRLREVSKTPEENPEGDKDSPNTGRHAKEGNRKKDYAAVQDYFEKDLAFSQVAVMKKALGWEDDKVGANRSLFGKMLHQDKNDEGGLYQFDDDQLDRVRSAIKNKQ